MSEQLIPCCICATTFSSRELNINDAGQALCLRCDAENKGYEIITPEGHGEFEPLRKSDEVALCLHGRCAWLKTINKFKFGEGLTYRRAVQPRARMTEAERNAYPNRRLTTQRKNT